MEWKLENYGRDWFRTRISYYNNKRPDLVIWNKKDKKTMLMKLTVPWEENFEQTEEWKVKRYEEFFQELELEIDFYYIAFGYRGFVGKVFLVYL